MNRQIYSVRRDGTDRDFIFDILSFSKSAEVQNGPDVIFERRGNRVHMKLSNFPHYYGQFVQIRYHVSTIAYYLLKSDPSIKTLTVNCSDGESPSDARFAFSSFNPQTILLPDPHFYLNRGYKSLDIMAASGPAWHDRTDDIIWRGATTGIGHISIDESVADNPVVLQRLRLAYLAKGSEVDFKFVKMDINAQHFELMKKEGLTGEFVKQNSWLNRKYAIDVDGMTNTWGNFIIRLKLGCCVLKVDSVLGFRQWYYDRIVPWEHYVPVKADLSDFFEKVEWVKTNQDKAAEIAMNGQAFARTLTFESARSEALELIETNWER